MAVFGGLGEAETVTKTMGVQELETEIAKFIYELETEDRLVRVGLKEESQTAAIYKKYKELFTRQTLQQARQESQKTKKSKKKDILERIYYTLAGSFCGLAVSALEDAIKTYFSRSTVKVGGETLAYFEISPRISKEQIFEKREIYDSRATSIITKINPKQLVLLQNEIVILKSLGFGGYMDYFAKATRVDYHTFFKVVKKIIGETDKLWASVIGKVSKESLGRPFVNIRACHFLYLRSMSLFDNYYPKDKVVSTFIRWAGDLGLGDLLLRIQIDDKDRPKKNPRAVCYWPKPPDEIHLVIKPIGGEQDFEAMFHEGGHALHGAAIDKSLPYSLKTLAHSNALTEAYAFIFEDLVFDPDFARTYLNVSAFSGNKIKWQAYFVNLMMLRRYLGKFSYEYEMFSGLARGRSLTEGPTLYKRNLDAATGFIHRKENWLSDMDSGFYSSNYLRAWIGASQIKDYLTGKFGRRWFINKKAGLFLRELFARGVTDELEDVVRRLGYKPWDTSFLMKEYRRVLD